MSFYGTKLSHLGTLTSPSAPGDSSGCCESSDTPANCGMVTLS